MTTSTEFRETSQIDGDVSMGSVLGVMVGEVVVFPVFRGTQGGRARRSWRCWAMYTHDAISCMPHIGRGSRAVGEAAGTRQCTRGAALHSALEVNAATIKDQSVQGIARTMKVLTRTWRGSEVPACFLYAYPIQRHSIGTGERIVVAPLDAPDRYWPARTVSLRRRRSRAVGQI